MKRTDQMILKAVKTTEAFKKHRSSENAVELDATAFELFKNIFEIIDAGWSYQLWESQTSALNLVKEIAKELFEKHGIITVSRYRTYDGELFDTSKQAKDHIKNINLRNSIIDFLDKHDVTSAYIDRFMEAIDEDFAGFRSLFEK